MVELDSTDRDQSKKDFFTNFLARFSDKSSLSGNLLGPIERSSQSLPIPMVLGLEKKSPPVSINQFIYLLLFVDFDCPQPYLPVRGSRSGAWP